MIAWPPPFVPSIPASHPNSTGESTVLWLHDTATRTTRPVSHDGSTAGVYVCGITPYDATHMGHAATYVTFDLVIRALIDAGVAVTYVQNITDVDDPLLERAARDGVDWRDLAISQIALFRDDMTALGVIPPDHYVGVVESIDRIADRVRDLVRRGTAYPVPIEDVQTEDGALTYDIYLDAYAQPGFGEISGWDREQMMEVFAERGGDPERIGKRDALDPLLWRAARTGEPSWPGGTIGRGRPGWHIECTTIALDFLGSPFAVQGGGTDLIFPHHEMSACQGHALTGSDTFAGHYVHQAMVGFEGEKMSKSKGNLVLVSQLRHAGVDPMAVRLALLDRHYAGEWEWTHDLLEAAQDRLRIWHDALSVNSGPPADETVAAIRRHLNDNLDTPAALRAVDAWAHTSLTIGGTDPGAPGILNRALDALLGIRL